MYMNRYINENIYENERGLVASYPCSQRLPCPGFSGRGCPPCPGPGLWGLTARKCCYISFSLLYIYIYVYIYMHILIHLYISVYKYICIHLLISLYIHVSIYIYICILISGWWVVVVVLLDGCGGWL